jgi:hypothetical protein
MNADVHFMQFVVRFPNSSRVGCRAWTVFDEQKKKPALRFQSVLIDQCLKSRIGA